MKRNLLKQLFPPEISSVLSARARPGHCLLAFRWPSSNWAGLGPPVLASGSRGKTALGGDLSTFLWPWAACTDQGKTISALAEQEPSWTKGNSSRNNIKWINFLQKTLSKAFRPEILKNKLPRKRSAQNSMGSTLKAWAQWKQGEEGNGKQKLRFP